MQPLQGLRSKSAEHIDAVTLPHAGSFGCAGSGLCHKWLHRSTALACLDAATCTATLESWAALTRSVPPALSQPGLTHTFRLRGEGLLPK